LTAIVQVFLSRQLKFKHNSQFFYMVIKKLLDALLTALLTKKHLQSWHFEVIHHDHIDH